MESMKHLPRRTASNAYSACNRPNFPFGGERNNKYFFSPSLLSTAVVDARLVPISSILLFFASIRFPFGVRKTLMLRSFAFCLTFVGRSCSVSLLLMPHSEIVPAAKRPNPPRSCCFARCRVCARFDGYRMQ